MTPMCQNGNRTALAVPRDGLTSLQRSGQAGIDMRTSGALLAAAWLAAGSAGAQPPVAPPLDYAKDASWLCRPGRTDACSHDLNAVRVDAQGVRTPAPFRIAADAPVDCFYVYPTVSKQDGPYSDGTETADETYVVRNQAARLGGVCRVFAPLYRSATLTGLIASLRPGGPPRADYAVPYADVKAAWRRYLEHDNHGRGVVLVGHSQGSIHLTRLLKEEIDGKPVQKLLVSAILAGPRGIATPVDKDVGGTFTSIPLCRSGAQAGCVTAWSTYAEEDATPDRVFGRNPGAGLAAACVDPAAPQGGRAMLKADLPRPGMAPPTDPPFVEAIGQLSGECVTDAQGSVLRVRVEPGRYAELFKATETEVTRLPSWGLHVVDVSFTAGNLRDLIAAQSASWLSAKR